MNDHYTRIIALYILSLDRGEYDIYVEEGNDPRDHVRYAAAVVMGYEDEYNEDVQNYLRKEG